MGKGCRTCFERKPGNRILMERQMWGKPGRWEEWATITKGGSYKRGERLLERAVFSDGYEADAICKPLWGCICGDVNRLSAGKPTERQLTLF